MGEVGSPERNSSILVSKMNHGIVGVLAHRMTCSELRTMLYDELSSRGVLVFEIASVALQEVRKRT